MESGQHCQRALTCKMHSMSAKRAVPGRSMDFDKVMAAYRSSRALTGSQRGHATKSVQPSTIEGKSSVFGFSFFSRSNSWEAPNGRKSKA